MEEDRYIRITLRMPRDTHLLLSNAAEAKTHSMNAEIVSRLESSFKRAPAPLADDYLEKIEELLDRKLEPLLKQMQSQETQTKQPPAKVGGLVRRAGD